MKSLSEKPYPVHRLISTYNNKPICPSSSVAPCRLSNVPTPLSLRNAEGNPKSFNDDEKFSQAGSMENGSNCTSEYGFYQSMQTPESIRGLLTAVADKGEPKSRGESDIDIRLKNILMENEKLSKRINVDSTFSK